MTGVAGVGAYVPRLYLTAESYAEAWGRGGPSGVDRTAVPDADEDSLTMAAEAATRALSAADVDAGAVRHLAFATTTPPDDEAEVTPRLSSLLGVSRDATARQFGGGTRAGAAALAATLDAETPALVAVADAPRGAPESDEEAAAGAGAAALVLTDDGPLVVDAVGEYGEPYPGTRFRRRGSAETESLGITQYERDAYTSAVGGAVDELGADVGDADAAALTAPDGRLPYRATGAAGVSAEQVAAGTVVSRVGDAGAAGPFLGLASALAEGAESALLVGYGGGSGATALSLRTEEAVPVAAVLDGDVELTYPEYLRRRGVVTGDEPEGGGAYVSVPSWKRTLPQRHRLVAGRCDDCGALAFPPEGVCGDCGSLAGFEEVRLPGTGTVEAATVIGQGGAPPEFVEQQQRSGAFAVVVVAFDGPDGEESVSAPAQVVASPADAPDVGDRVEAVTRRVYEQEGVVRYGFKVVPSDARR